MKKSRFSEEQMVGILREGDRQDRMEVEVCQQYVISEYTFRQAQGPLGHQPPQPSGTWSSMP